MHPLFQCIPGWGLSVPVTPLMDIGNQFTVVPLWSHGLNPVNRVQVIPMSLSNVLIGMSSDVSESLVQWRDK